jgi:hypothetical protein
MHAIDCSLYLELIRSIERSESMPVGTFELVDSVTAWCREHGVPENHPDRIAKALTRNPDLSPLILVKSHISASQVEGVLKYMRDSGYGDVADAIRDEQHFFAVLCYHEIAHLKNPLFGEEDCDRWALNKTNA